MYWGPAKILLNCLKSGYFTNSPPNPISYHKEIDSEENTEILQGLSQLVERIGDRGGG